LPNPTGPVRTTTLYAALSKINNTSEYRDVGILLEYRSHFHHRTRRCRRRWNSEVLPPTVCPTSGLDYVYTSNGIFMPDRNVRVILYDASPAHSGIGWAVSILEPVPGQPLQTRVMATSGELFLLRPAHKSR